MFGELLVGSDRFYVVLEDFGRFWKVWVWVRPWACGGEAVRTPETSKTNQTLLGLGPRVSGLKQYRGAWA